MLVPWPSAPLKSRERRTVRVRVWGEDHRPLPWSDEAIVEAGLLEPSDWQAEMITPTWPEDPVLARPVAMLRRQFTLDGEVDCARLYATAHGLYEGEMNGQRVGDQVLVPGWTSYASRLRYHTYDVTGHLKDGENALGFLLADGWYRGRLTWEGGRRNVFGDRLGLLAQLEVRFTDGRMLRIGTDASWRASTGPIRSSDLYDGETYDATLEQKNWSSPGFDDALWTPCRVLAMDFGKLVAPDGPPVRAIETVRPVAVLTTPAGKTLLDFGQNLVGRLRIRVCGPRGKSVTFRHAEVLEDGELCVRPLRSAQAVDSYTLRGDDEPEDWEPRFTIHGFRYAEVSGWPVELQAGDVEAVVYHSDMKRTGWFECSDELLNRLHENVVWGMRGNFVDVPTDCPQRDERLGWTGDVQIFAATAAFLYDCSGFLASWLADLAADQTDEGIAPIIVPHIDVPTASHERVPAVAGWGDAAVIVPWLLYQRFEDAALLRRQYASMCRWVDALTARFGERTLWPQEFQFGDWLDPAAPPDDPAAATTDRSLVATAYRARSAQIVADAAQLLGFEADAFRYAELARGIRDAFNDEYVTMNGRLVSDSQTAYALALEFALLPSESQRERAGDRLAEIVRTAGHRIATGFLGTPLICDALTGAGALDDAYGLLLQTQCPSWLYAVTMGATTIWERWDSMLPDGGINPGEMTSFNHYALGSVADWMHRVVAGLAPAAPGYRRLLVRPRPGGGLTYAKATHLTPYGRAEVAWRREGQRLEVDILVPTGTTAVVALPGRERIEVGPGRKSFTCVYRAPQDDPRSDAAMGEPS